MSKILPFNGYTSPQDLFTRIEREYSSVKGYIVGVIHPDGTYTWHWSTMPVGELACASILLHEQVSKLVANPTE